ncbi:hypothetical protein F5890DRAFT_1560445 [Lentinula detonsa]|uniref:Uncharacterized protein n=1 Tax=Lentinula detonsa TaxID=2804962 RepID=A0AA38UL36_9AGAR|nr:hypothetical protein F5890DRAFT_1560445 [Lentinula detonsa]
MIVKGGCHSDSDGDSNPEQDGASPPFLPQILRRAIQRVPGAYQLVDHWSAVPNLRGNKRRLA